MYLKVWPHESVGGLDNLLDGGGAVLAVLGQVVQPQGPLVVAACDQALA